MRSALFYGHVDGQGLVLLRYDTIGSMIPPTRLNRTGSPPPPLLVGMLTTLFQSLLVPFVCLFVWSFAFMNFSYVVTAMSSISLCFVLLFPLGFPAAAILIGIYHHSGGAGVEGLLGLTLFAGFRCGGWEGWCVGERICGLPLDWFARLCSGSLAGWMMVAGFVWFRVRVGSSLVLGLVLILDPVDRE